MLSSIYIIWCMIYTSSAQFTTSLFPASIEDENDFQLLTQETKNGILNFTIEFQKHSFKSCKSNENRLFSPINIVGILATLLLGAESHSKNEILESFGFVANEKLANKEEKIQKTIGDLFRIFTSENNINPAVKINISNAIFIQKGTSIQSQFQNLSKTIYNNEINSVDFSSSDNKATEIINNWINNRTHQQIREIIPGPLPFDTKLVLINTLFFNGEWETPFTKNSVWRPFYSNVGMYKVKMMSNLAPVYYNCDNNSRNFSVLGLPYKGGNTVMYIILPKIGQSLKYTLSHLTLNNLKEISEKSVNKYKISYEIPFMNIADELNLEDNLQALGIKSIFNSSSANLSHLAKDVFVSRALHKVNLNVTEAGTTGSASSFVIIQNRFPTVSFIVNRPFSFYIYHRSSSFISFWGSINLPVPNVKEL